MDDELLSSWDALNVAIGRVLNAQPHQMTRAAQLLEKLQEDFDNLIRRTAAQVKESDRG
jgi:hypothetical protein